MGYKAGDKIVVRINKIQDNGCYCSFHPLHCNQYGFMPKILMPSMIDSQGNFMVSVGDDITVIIEKYNEKGFLLSDIETYEKEQEKLRKKEEKPFKNNELKVLFQNINLAPSLKSKSLVFKTQKSL